MKQFIVLITTIVLGIAIAAMIMGFKTPAQKMGQNIQGSLNSMVTEYSSPSALSYTIN